MPGHQPKEGIRGPLLPDVAITCHLEATLQEKGMCLWVCAHVCMCVLVGEMVNGDLDFETLDE